MLYDFSIVLDVFTHSRCFSFFVFFFSSRRRHTRLTCDWSSDVCSSDLARDSKHAPGRRPLILRAPTLPIAFDGPSRVSRGANEARAPLCAQRGDRLVVYEAPRAPRVTPRIAESNPGAWLRRRRSSRRVRRHEIPDARAPQHERIEVGEQRIALVARAADAVPRIEIDAEQRGCVGRVRFPEPRGELGCVER